MRWPGRGRRGAEGPDTHTHAPPTSLGPPGARTYEVVADDRALGEGGALGQWLDSMPLRLDVFRESVLPGGFRMDFSGASLTDLEQLALARFAGWRDVGDPRHREWVELAVRYLGETYLRAGGGHWEHVEDPGTYGPEYQHRFVVLPDVPVTRPVDPLQRLTAAADKRTGREFVRVHETLVRRAAERSVSDPGWRPAKQETPGLDVPPPRPPSPLLLSWLAATDGADVRWPAEHVAAGPWDGTPESFDRLEALVAERYPTGESVRAEEHDAFRDGAARYLGDLVLQRRGGAWTYKSTERDDHDPFVGAPYVARYDDLGDLTFLVPALAFELVADGRRGLLRDMVARYCS